MAREFDLNIERVLENWTVAHALREVIANALDEQALTNTKEPEIFQDDAGRWHVRDWGRGLRYEHLTQNENREKLAHADKVVGKFGVGLKDALATFDRHRITVVIRSPHGDITTGKQAKHGFADIKTLHALISDPADPALTGTEFILHGSALREKDVRDAKALFLRFASEDSEQTQPGSQDWSFADLRWPHVYQPVEILLPCALEEGSALGLRGAGLADERLPQWVVAPDQVLVPPMQLLEVGQVRDPGDFPFGPRLQSAHASTRFQTPSSVIQPLADLG